jgi:hypothetical protein
MKPQDVVFLVVLIFLLLSYRKKFLLAAGLLCYAIAIPLFAKWIFFTAERLTWYGSLFILLALLIPNRSKGTVK